MIVKKTLVTQWQEKLGRDYFVGDDYDNVAIYRLIPKRFIIWCWYGYDYIYSIKKLELNGEADFTQTITTKDREFAEHCDKLGLNVILEV